MATKKVTTTKAKKATTKATKTKLITKQEAAEALHWLHTYAGIKADGNGRLYVTSEPKNNAQRQARVIVGLIRGLQSVLEVQG